MGEVEHFPVFQALLGKRGKRRWSCAARSSTYPRAHGSAVCRVTDARECGLGWIRRQAGRGEERAGALVPLALEGITGSDRLRRAFPPRRGRRRACGVSPPYRAEAGKSPIPKLGAQTTQSSAVAVFEADLLEITGSHHPTLSPAYFHLRVPSGTTPSSAFLQICPFLRLPSTRPYRYRVLGEKICSEYRHSYRGARSSPTIEFSRPPSEGWCPSTRRWQGSRPSHC